MSNTTVNVLKQAIVEGRAVVIKYGAALRLVEPIAIGSSTSGLPSDRLVANQPSDDLTKPEWRTFLLSDVVSVTATDRAIGSTSRTMAKAINLAYVEAAIK